MTLKMSRLRDCGIVAHYRHQITRSIMKVCSKCGEAGEFSSCKKSRDGLQSQCKSCKSIATAAYYRSNPERRFKRNKEQAKARYEQNKVSMNISRGIRKSLGRHKNGYKWESLLGYSLEDLKSHLASLFSDGMTWENYGDWHIDHIRPVSSFDIKDEYCQDFIDCWSLTNLQPLWAKDNLSKGSKW